jgi:hypothetical protein
MIALPDIKHVASEVIETIFVPKIIARQLALAIALETGAVRTHISIKYMQNDYFDNSIQLTYCNLLYI